MPPNTSAFGCCHSGVALIYADLLSSWACKRQTDRQTASEQATEVGEISEERDGVECWSMRHAE